MERVPKENRETAKRVTQGKSATHPAQGDIADRLNNSPHMIAQRKKLQSLFGGAAQLKGAEDETLQGKFETAQRAGEEELLQKKHALGEEEFLPGKFGAAQRVTEEEPLQGKFEAVQRVAEEEPIQHKLTTAQRATEEEPLQGKFEAVQRATEEEPLQHKLASDSPAQLAPAEKKPNNTGLPDNLKSGIENLSGMSMDNVKVHYNSSQPAQLNALAYAQGTDIHVAPGQEQHLPHEAWHVVQQAQGRVQPTMQMKGGVPVNDDKGLEHEADVMGGRAVQFREDSSKKLQQMKVAKGVTQFWWTRWYEFDGTNYNPRFVGLPAMTGWIKMPDPHEGLDVYISVTNLNQLPAIRNIEEGVDNLHRIVDEHAPLLANVTSSLQSHSQQILDIERVQAEFLSIDRALGNYLTRTTTFLKILGTVLGFSVAITGGVLLSYITLPMWAVAAIEGLSFLYGCGLLYRWSQSELLPTMVKIGMLIANGGIMAIASGTTVAQIIAYATQLTTTMPLQHIQFAAIPLALLIEHFIVMLIEKVNSLRQAYNRQNGHNEDHLD